MINKIAQYAKNILQYISESYDHKDAIRNDKTKFPRNYQCKFILEKYKGIRNIKLEKNNNNIIKRYLFVII